MVALAEDPSVRLTTRIVGGEPAEVAIGQEVAVRFEHHEDVWLPLFAPTGEESADDPVAEPERPGPGHRWGTTGSSTVRCCPAWGGRRWAAG